MKPSPAMKESMKMGWLSMVNRSKRPAVYISDEEIDAMERDYLAKGGVIKACPPMGALGDIPVEATP